MPQNNSKTTPKNQRPVQSARKSTATIQAHHSQKKNESQAIDPVKFNLNNILQTKRRSLTPAPLDCIRDRGSGQMIYGHVKVKPRIPRGELALKQIKKLQAGHQLLIPRAIFHRLIREISQEFGKDLKYQTIALEALQEAAENYLVTMFEGSYLCTTHAKRVTLFASDIHLYRRIRGEPY